MPLVKVEMIKGKSREYKSICNMRLDAICLTGGLSRITIIMVSGWQKL